MKLLVVLVAVVSWTVNESNAAPVPQNTPLLADTVGGILDNVLAAVGLDGSGNGLLGAILGGGDNPGILSTLLGGSDGNSGLLAGLVGGGKSGNGLITNLLGSNDGGLLSGIIGGGNKPRTRVSGGPVASTSTGGGGGGGGGVSGGAVRSESPPKPQPPPATPKTGGQTVDSKAPSNGGIDSILGDTSNLSASEIAALLSNSAAPGSRSLGGESGKSLKAPKDEAQSTKAASSAPASAPAPAPVTN